MSPTLFQKNRQITSRSTTIIAVTRYFVELIYYSKAENYCSVYVLKIYVAESLFLFRPINFGF